MFVRAKKIKGRKYYYIVKSTRLSSNKWKKIERYVGSNPPSKNELKRYEKEFDSIKEFFLKNNEELEQIKNSYIKKIKNSTKDEIDKLEEEIIIKFTYDTSRIEGSSLTYKDTKMLLQDGITPSEKPLRDIKETENHKSAYIFMKNSLHINITKEFVLELHRILKEGVTEDAGKFRDANVRVGDFIALKPDMIEVEIGNLINWYNKNKERLHALELAAIFHCIFERIHPFFDGNGRVGRLLLNFILLKNEHPIAIVQNKNKRRYYNALKHADNGNYLYMVKYLFYEMRKQMDYYSCNQKT